MKQQHQTLVETTASLTRIFSYLIDTLGMEVFLGKTERQKGRCHTSNLKGLLQFKT